MPFPDPTTTILKPVPDGDFGELAFKNILDVWVTPAVVARQAAGELPVPLPMSAAQVIFRLGKQPIVRVNNEVKALVHIPADTVKVGEQYLMHTVAGVTKVELADDERDFGHVTILRLGDGYKMFFDFRYNQRTAMAHVVRAKEFLAAAEFALNSGYAGAFVENLLTANELAAKALLFGELLDPQFRKVKTHSIIHSEFNLLAKRQQVLLGQAEVFNDLARQRSAARFLDGELKLDLGADDASAREMFSIVRSLIDRLIDHR